MSTGDRFIDLRKALSKNRADEINQSEAGALIGVNRNSWRRYEAGELPNGQAMARLAALGVSVDWLLTGQGQMMVGDTNPPTETPDTDQEARIKQLSAQLAAEQEKTKAWIEGAKNLLAGCIMAVDQMAAEQRIRMSPKQRASAITAMFIELGSLSDDEIHAMAADAQKNDKKSGGGRR